MYRVLLPLLLVCTLAIGACTSGRFNTDLGNHSLLVAESREEGSTVVSLDTIFKAGAPYGVLKAKSINMLQTDYIFYTLSGEEVINVTQSDPKSGDKTWQEYKFLDREANGSAYIEYSMSTMSVVDRIVDSDLMSPTGLNAGNATRFMLRYPDPDNRPKAPEANRMVDRDRSRPVNDNLDGNITQGTVLIGTYTKSRGSQNGVDITTATIYYRDRNVAATAKYKTFGSDTTEVTTTKDNKKHTIDGSRVNRSNIQQAAQYLVDNLYL